MSGQRSHFPCTFASVKTTLHDERTIVPPNEAVPVFGFELSVYVIFFRLFHGNVKIAIQTGQYPAILEAGIELDPHGSPQYGFQKVGR